MSKPETSQMSAPLPPQAIASGHEGNLRDQISAYGSRLKNGEMGALPAVGALAVLTALFASLSPFFLTKLNIANLFVQAAELTTLAVALVFVISCLIWRLAWKRRMQIAQLSSCSSWA